MNQKVSVCLILLGSLNHGLFLVCQLSWENLPVYGRVSEKNKCFQVCARVTVLTRDDDKVGDLLQHSLPLG